MAGITLAQAEAKLATWLTAEEAVATNQSYTHGDYTYTRANAAEITNKFVFWDKQVKRLTRGGIRVTHAPPTG